MHTFFCEYGFKNKKFGNVQYVDVSSHFFTITTGVNDAGRAIRMFTFRWRSYDVDTSSKNYCSNPVDLRMVESVSNDAKFNYVNEAVPQTVQWRSQYSWHTIPTKEVSEVFWAARSQAVSGTLFTSPGFVQVFYGSYNRDRRYVCTVGTGYGDNTSHCPGGRISMASGNWITEQTFGSFNSGINQYIFVPEFLSWTSATDSASLLRPYYSTEDVYLEPSFMASGSGVEVAPVFGPSALRKCRENVYPFGSQEADLPAQVSESMVPTYYNGSANKGVFRFVGTLDDIYATTKELNKFVDN